MDTTNNPQATTALATIEPPSLRYSSDEKALIIKSFMPGASETEANAIIATAERMGLDIFKRQIFPVKRSAYNEDTGRYEDRWAFQVSIDGFRGRAEETGEYDGSDEPQFTFEERINPLTGEPLGGKELVARVTVHRRGRRPVTGVARWSEFVQKKRDGQPVRMWVTMPHHMLAKCAEALALRQRFPERLGGLYTEDEIGNRAVAEEIEEQGGSAGAARTGDAKRRVSEQAAGRKEKRESATAAAAAGNGAAPPAEEKKAEPVDVPARAKELASQLDAVHTPAEFNTLWRPVTTSPHFEEMRAVPELAESFKRNKARIWPTPAAPAADQAPKAEPKPEPDPLEERWMSEISRAGGDEGARLWNAINEAWEGNVPARVLEAYAARWPLAESGSQG